MMKTLLLIAATALLTFQVQAEPGHRHHHGWTDKDDVTKRTGRAVKRADRFQEHTGGIGDIAELGNGVRQLSGAMRRLQEQVERGRDYDSLVGDFKSIRQQYQQLEKEYNQRHSRHRDWRVAYGWNSVTLGYLDLEWAFTQGETLD